MVGVFIQGLVERFGGFLCFFFLKLTDVGR